MQMRWLQFVCRIAVVAIGCQVAQPGAQPPATAATPTASSLVGTSWTAEDIDGRGIIDRVQSTLTFESAERVSGSTGCNRYLAPLQLSGTSLNFGMGSSTRRACPPAVMDQERRFLTALHMTKTYRQEGGTLWLLDESGGTLVRLTQTDAAAQGRQPPEGAPSGGEVPIAMLKAYTFTCANGPSFVVHLVDNEAIDLILAEGTRRLRHEQTASGTKYSDEEITVWNKGREAVLEVAGHTYQCAEDRAQSIHEDARLRGVEFRGTGNEPPWVLEVLADRLVFISNYGTERLATPRPTALVDPANAATVYTATTETRQLEVRIEDRECVDSMSGERFAAMVTVETEGRRYQGCGKAPALTQPPPSHLPYQASRDDTRHGPLRWEQRRPALWHGLGSSRGL